MTKDKEICYLCGKELKDHISKDHVPPKQFFPRSLRPRSGQLLRIPCHVSCNTGYQSDEDYFVHTLGPLAMKTNSGRELFQDIVRQFQRPAGRIIGKMIYGEFEHKLGDIAFPYGKVAKRFDGQRVWRVVWKIVCGLFFHSTGRFLPEDTPLTYEIHDIEEEPSEELKHLDLQKQQGQAPGIFDWKHLDYTDIPGVNHFHLIGLLLWDKIVMLTAFHDPECSCNICKKKSA